MRKIYGKYNRAPLLLLLLIFHRVFALCQLWLINTEDIVSIVYITCCVIFGERCLIIQPVYGVWPKKKWTNIQLTTFLGSIFFGKPFWPFLCGSHWHKTIQHSKENWMNFHLIVFSPTSIAPTVYARNINFKSGSIFLGATLYIQCGP